MAHITSQKTSVVDKLTDLISRSKSVAVVDYKGLKVSAATELRRLIKKSGGEIFITKNTLFAIASGKTDLNLTGPSAFIFSLTDEVTTIKALADFAKKNSLPTFKMGLLSDRVLSAAEVTQLASIPDKKTLLSQTLGSLTSPLFGLVYNLNWPLSQLVRTLEAIRVSKGGETK